MTDFGFSGYFNPSPQYSRASSSHEPTFGSPYYPLDCADPLGAMALGAL